MSYKLYTDKQETFECKIHLEGASLSKATSRILVETSDLKLMFEGTIDKDGNCQVPIKKLRGLVNENDKGNIKLEVIAEDTYFMPWESDFEVDTSKKIKVEVKQQNKPVIQNSKPKMTIKGVTHPFNPVDKITETLENKGVTVKSFVGNKKKLLPIIKEYYSAIEYKGSITEFIKEVIHSLSKK
tara:strand:- start:222 stop:773 length:552 start_codon:yes stop_codon:yes gene_type:complete